MYSAEEFLKNRSIEISKIKLNNTQENNYEHLKEFDKAKSKVLKYALYKKRTEHEIRQKFSKELEENVLNDIIEVLKENSYINDYNYIEKTINEYKKMKNLSIKEVKYKLLAKGIKNKLIEEYILNNIDEMNEYEQKSAYSIMCKKRCSMEYEAIKLYLMKKGYKEDSINNVLSEEK